MEEMDMNQCAFISAHQLLCDYIAIRSSHPDASTEEAALFLNGVLKDCGVESFMFRAGGGKYNLLSHLPGRGASPIILLHHMDVVRAEHHQFEPKIRDGCVVGRGAIDDKGLGVIHLLAFLRLAEDVKRGVELTRPVCFLAVCDEEIAGTSGAKFMINKLFGEGGLYNKGSGDEPLMFEEPPVIFDEGGYWISDLFSKPICNIAIAEKSQLVLKIVFNGKAGHGSVPPRAMKDSAKLKAARAEFALFEAQEQRRLVLNPASEQIMRSIRSLKFGGVPLPLKVVAKLASAKNDKIFALTHDTIASTAEESDADINVVPSRVIRYFDIRLLPGSDSQEMIRFVRDVLTEKAGLSPHDFEIEIARRPLGDATFKISDTSSNIMKVVKHVINQHNPNAEVAASMCPGFTDSRWFRAIGCDAYGIVPVMLTSDQLDNIHGANERIPIDGLENGVEIMSEILENLV